MGDRLAVLSRARPWAMSTAELVDALDAVQVLVVEANATLLRLVREVDARGIAKDQGRRRRRCGYGTGIGCRSVRRTGW